MGSGDIAWVDYGPIDVNSSASLYVYCGSGGSGTVSVTVDFFDRPATSVTFAGISTPGTTDNVISGSDLPFVVPGQARYVADVTLQQGAVDLQLDNDGSTTTVASSGEVALGVLGAGTHDLYVTPEDGPPAQWSITIHALPVRMLSLSVDRKFARPSQIDTFSYQYEGDVSESVTIQNSAGQVVRTLATDLPVDSNQHSLVWDGLDSTGAPVPDGVYNAVFSWTDPAGYTGSAATALTIDSTPPVATILSPLPLTESHGLVFSIGDALSGVASAKATVDGTRVPNVPSSGGTVVYEPSGGWTPGQHVLEITATDNAGNKLTFEKRFDVAAPPQSRRPTSRHCPGVTLHFRGQGAYHVYDLTSTTLITCRFAQNLARAAYGLGPLHPRYVPTRGRGDESVKGGWLCETGAGGGTCSNRSARYNKIEFARVGAHRIYVAVEFSIRVY